ncbi:MAG: hypothetical protein WCJ64_03400 [Rhodospirillaceae bacterium]
MSDEPVYATSKALVAVHKIVAEAGKALKDSSWTIKGSEISELLAATGGVGVGAAAGVGIMAAGAAAGTSGAAALTSGLAAAGGIVGGGMVAGIAVVAAPAVVLGVAGVLGVSWWNKKKLTEEKEALLQQAISKHDAIARCLRDETDLNSQRVDDLKRLNALLMEAIQNLRSDLNYRVV